MPARWSGLGGPARDPAGDARARTTAIRRCALEARGTRSRAATAPLVAQGHAHASQPEGSEHIGGIGATGHVVEVGASAQVSRQLVGQRHGQLGRHLAGEVE